MTPCYYRRVKGKADVNPEAMNPRRGVGKTTGSKAKLDTCLCVKATAQPTQPSSPNSQRRNRIIRHCTGAGKPPTPQPPERREGERPGEEWDEDNIASTPGKPRRAIRKAMKLETC